MDLFNEDIHIIKDEESLIILLESIKNNCGEELRKEKSFYDTIKSRIYSNNKIKEDFIYWIEDLSAYGEGLTVKFIDNKMEVINIVKDTEDKSNGEKCYYAYIKIYSVVEDSTFGKRYFNPKLHLKINITNDIFIFELVGIEGGI